jgi:hypothetical protein
MVYVDTNWGILSVAGTANRKKMRSSKRLGVGASCQSVDMWTVSFSYWIAAGTKVHASRPLTDLTPSCCTAVCMQYVVVSLTTLRVLSCLQSPRRHSSCCKGVRFCYDLQAWNLSRNKQESINHWRWDLSSYGDEYRLFSSGMLYCVVW